MRASIVSIVEGHGDVEAVETLLRRIARTTLPGLAVQINAPIRVKAGSFINDSGYFTRYVTLAAAKAAQSQGMVLILLDCENDCPATLGPRLLQEAQKVRSDVNYLVALAYREFETWFVTAIDSLRGPAGFRSDLEKPQDPESIRDAKGWLNSSRANGYDPVIDQAAFVSLFDFEEAKASHSFRRLYNRIHAYFVASRLSGS